MREKTRRFLTTALFLFFGPIALALTAIGLYWQKSPQALTRTQSRISQSLRYEVSLNKYEALFPGAVRLQNVEIYSPQTDESILFCPEIYAVRIADQRLLKDFIASLNRRGRTEKDKKDNLVDSSSEDELNNVELNSLFSSLKPITNNTETSSYSVIIIPEVFYGSTHVTELIDALCNRLLRTVKSDISTTSLCIVANKIHLLTEKQYVETLKNTTPPSGRFTKQDLLRVFRTAVYLTPRGETNSTYELNQAETLAFAAESPTITRFRAYHYNDKKIARTDVLFELSKISASVPYYAVIEKDKNTDISRIEYDSSFSSSPGSLASAFVPSLSFLGNGGWFTGRVLATITPNDNQYRCNVEINNAHFCNCHLEDLSKRFALPALTGTVTDLAINKGQIVNGVFRGKGSIRIINGSIPVKVVQRLNSMKIIETSPKQALQLRFINDETPFNELELLFSFNENGVVLDSNYRNKIIAFYEKDSVKYGLFLSESTAGTHISYARSLTAFFETRDANSFWNPLVKNALNHLPVRSAASLETEESLMR